MKILLPFLLLGLLVVPTKVNQEADLHRAECIRMELGAEDKSGNKGNLFHGNLRCIWNAPMLACDYRTTGITLPC